MLLVSALMVLLVRVLGGAGGAGGVVSSGVGVSAFVLGVVLALALVLVCCGGVYGGAGGGDVMYVFRGSLLMVSGTLVVFSVVDIICIDGIGGAIRRDHIK